MKNFFILITSIFLFYQKSLFAMDYGNYLAGESAMLKKDNLSAIKYFEDAIDINNLDTKYGRELAEKLCSLYLLEGQINKCISFEKSLENKIDTETIQGTNILMALVVGDIKNRNFDSALERLGRMKKSSYERFSVPIIEAWLIAVGKKDYKNAKKKLTELDNDTVVNGLRYLNSALIDEVFDKKDESIKNYQKSLNSFARPSFRLVEITANAFERNGELNKAKDLFTKFYKDSNDYLLVEKSLNEIGNKKSPKKIIENLDDAIAELFSTIASTFSSDFTNNFSIIYSHFSLYLKKDFEVSKLYLAELMEENGRYADANNLYTFVKPTSNFYWHTRLKVARNLELMGENQKSISILKKMSNEKKDRYDSLKLLGDIYRNYDKYNEAIKSYNEAIARIDEIKSIHWELLYSRGIALERNNNWGLAEKDFLKILEISPDQPDVLNYLGYSWIEKKLI